MRARLGALIVALAALAAPSASAAVGSLAVKPGSPVVGQRSTIELRASIETLRRAPLVQLVSPTGVARTFAMRKVAAGRWRLLYQFPDDGTWTIRLLTGAVAAPDKVNVVQNATPFAPKVSPKGSLGGIATGNGVGVLGH